eukprot:INCI12384.1.p1 GENE.INCI12384.1~~INCI12384.1.p1  ORF type:complete len:464 (+),score=66.61 INCI12384.1:77-1393(+)
MQRQRQQRGEIKRKHKEGVEGRKRSGMQKKKAQTSHILIRHSPRKCKVNDSLVKHSTNVTSQSGEDGIIDAIFQLVDELAAAKNSPRPPARRARRVVEFGCWDGKHLSNSWHLVKECGWNAVLIEADETKFSDLINNYGKEIDCGRVCALNEVVTFDERFSSVPEIYNRTQSAVSDGSSQIRSLNRILDSVLSPENDTIDFLCVDIDGCDYHVLDSLLSEGKRRPLVICVEFNPTIPNHITFIQARCIAVQQGSSLRALVDLCKHFKYELVCTSTYNAFFVDSCELPGVLRHLKAQATVFPDDSLGAEHAQRWNDIDFMHDTPMATDLFQLYDGTLRIAGCKKLLWHRVGINEQQLQVLHPSKRTFPFAPGISSRAPTKEKRPSSRRTRQARARASTGVNFSKKADRFTRRSFLVTFSIGITVGVVGSWFMQRFASRV